MKRTKGKARERESVWDAAEKDEKQAKKKKVKFNEPWRFFQDFGESCDVIILDENLDDVFWRHEHAIFQTVGAKTKFLGHEPCIANSGPCPYCEDDNDPAMTIMLSVIVLKEYTSKKTKEVHEYSKKSLAIKRIQLSAFAKLEKIAIKQHGTLRGVCVTLERGEDKNAYRTGMPVADEDSGNLIAEFYTEDELVEEFGNKAKVGRDKKTVLKKKNEDIAIFDWLTIYPEPDADEIREANGMEVAGSRKANTEADDYDDEEIDYGNKPSSRKSKRKRKGKAEPEEEDAKPAKGRKRRKKAQEDEPEPKPKSSRRKRKGKAEPEETQPKKRKRGKRKPEPDGDDDDEPQFDD